MNPPTPEDQVAGIMRRSFPHSFTQQDYRGLWHLSMRPIAIPHDLKVPQIPELPPSIPPNPTDP